MDLRGHRILLINDDGIHAPGIELLEKVVRRHCDDVWVVAPAEERSGASHAISMHDPIRMRQLDDRHFAIKGSPTDCALMGIYEIMPEPPTLILSGINWGANLAEDVTMSGTVAGAIEAMAMGVPGIALSQTTWPERENPYAPAEAFAPGIIRRLVEVGWPNDVIININFPSRPLEEITEVEVTRQGFRDVAVRHAEKRMDLRGREYYWVGFRQERSSPADGTDLKAVYESRISVTPLHIDLTHMATVNALKGVLGGAPPRA